MKSRKDFQDKLFEASATCLMLVNGKREIVRVNEAALKLLGMDERELIGKACFETICPDQKDCPILDSGEKLEGSERYIVTKNGNRVPILKTVAKIEEDGENYLLESFVDITVRKRSEEALRQSEDKYRFLFEDSPTINLVIGVDGKIIDTNAEALKVVGYSPDEIRGRDVLELIVEEDREFSAKLLEKSYRGEDTPDVDIRIIAKDGSIRTVLFSRGNVVLCENDQPTGILVTGIDITERKRAEEALRNSEERYRNLVEGIHDIIYSLDITGAVTSINKASKALLGLEPEEILGKNIAEFIHKKTLQFVMEKLKQAGAGETISSEAVMIDKDGNQHDVEFSSTPIIKSGKVVGTRGIVRDITERKRAEEKIKAALQEKEVLLKEIHHRVKNNLQIITSLLSLEAGKQTDERTISALRDSQNRIKTMAHIHEMLYRSKDLGRIDLTRYLNDIVISIFSSYTTYLGSVDFELDIDDVYLGIDTTIPLGLIVNELVSNSIKHAFPDGGTGRVRISFNEKENGRFTLCVSDNGRGLPAGFDMGEAETLGFQLVSMMIKQLNGELELARGDGTAFSITFLR